MIKGILLIRSTDLYKGNKKPDLLGEDNTHDIYGSVDANLIEITHRVKNDKKVPMKL